MTKADQPLTLRLPFAMVDRHLRMEQILAAEPSRSWAQSLPLLAAFALTRPEKRFACRLLLGKRNIWLFRCNQRAFCGDFLAVDMSSDLPRLRPVVAIELKAGAGLRFGGAGAGNQLQRVESAVTELVEAAGVITKDAPVTLACGDGDEVLDWLNSGGIARQR
jgi:hypothetical protein